MNKRRESSIIAQDVLHKYVRHTMHSDMRDPHGLLEMVMMCVATGSSPRQRHVQRSARVPGTMTTLVQRVSKRSMNFANQRKAYMLRHVQGMAYEDISSKVVTLEGQHPSREHVRTVCEEFSVAKGCRPYKYKNSGRKAWKMTTGVQRYVLKRLLADRLTKVVTSTGLAAAVASAKEWYWRLRASAGS